MNNNDKILKELNKAEPNPRITMFFKSRLYNLAADSALAVILIIALKNQNWNDIKLRDFHKKTRELISEYYDVVAEKGIPYLRENGYVDILKNNDESVLILKQKLIDFYCKHYKIKIEPNEIDYR